jgi:hypothetical protein
MLKSFTTKQLIFIALMSAFMFVGDFILAAGIVVVTGIPLSGGIISLIFISFIYVTILLTVRKFGTATLIALIYTALASPTSSFGPPGFYKIMIGVVLGLVVDIILSYGKYKKWAFYLSIFFGFMIVAPVMWGMLVLLNLPGAEDLGNILLIFMLIQGVEALIGCWLARLVYNKKLSKLKIIKQISS